MTLRAEHVNFFPFARLSSLARRRIMARKNGNENFARDKDRQTKPVQHIFVLAHNRFESVENQFRAAGTNASQNVQQRAAGTKKNAVTDRSFPFFAKHLFYRWMLKALSGDKIESADV